MRWAIAQEYRVDNPASGAVVQALPRGGATVTNLKALPYGGVPGAIKALRETTASRSSKLAMELLILTATRGNEVRMAPWSEIDIESRTWVIPARRMKAGDRAPCPVEQRRYRRPGTSPRAFRR